MDLWRTFQIQTIAGGHGDPLKDFCKSLSFGEKWAGGFRIYSL
jgi:hypothetical protein